MHEHFRAFEVTQKSMAQAMTGMRTFDQPGNVGYNEGPIAGEPDDAEVGNQRGERVVRNLWPRRRDPRDHRRLAGVWKSHKADICEELQLQSQILFFARQSWLRLPRCAIRRCGKGGVAVTAEA